MLATSLLVGCAGNQGARPLHAETSTKAGGAVSEDAFAAAVADLIRTDPRSAERQQRLVGVMQRQFSRAARQFQSRSPERGLTALSGALYMLRTGEFRDELLGPDGVAAFRQAARELAARGDEGRARAAYEVLLRAGAPAERADTQMHLSALAAWNSDIAKNAGPVAGASQTANVAVARYLFEVSASSQKDATEAVLRWVEASAELRAKFRKDKQQPPREEANEALRAFASGPPMLVAIIVRNGDAKTARDLIDKTGLRQLLRRELGIALNHVSDEPSPETWLALARALRPLPVTNSEVHDDDDGVEDLEVFRVASTACVLEAYRLGPNSAPAALAAAAGLREYGLGESAPKLFVESVQNAPDAEFLDAAIAVLAAQMESELEADEPRAVRRTFRAGEALRKAAESSPESAGRLASVESVMADVELGQGELQRARELFTRAAQRKSNPQSVLGLAAIDVHDGRADSALSRLEARFATKVQDAPVAMMPLLDAQMALALADAATAMHNKSKADSALGTAFSAAQRARLATEPGRRVSANLLLANIYDRSGYADKAGAAIEVAADAAGHDKKLLSAVANEAATRAFKQNDLKATRDALHRGISYELAPTELAYFAVWARILERQSKAAPDPMVEKVLAQAADDSRWSGRVAGWALGRSRAAGLVESAEFGAERTEAQFYLAIEKRLAGDSAGAKAALDAAIAAGGIRAVEYAVAQNWLHPAPKTPVLLAAAP